MVWVENGHAPDEITAERLDPATGDVVATQPAYLFPAVAPSGWRVSCRSASSRAKDGAHTLGPYLVTADELEPYGPRH
jgi:hypothetical protein